MSIERTASIAPNRHRSANRCRGGFQTLPYEVGASTGSAFGPIPGIIGNIRADTLEIGIGTDDPVMETALPDPGVWGMPDSVYPPGGECFEAAHEFDKRWRSVLEMHHAMKVVRHYGEFVEIDCRVMRPQLQPAFFDNLAEAVRPPHAVFDTAEQASEAIRACRDEISPRRRVIVTGQAGRLTTRERRRFGSANRRRSVNRRRGGFQTLPYGIWCFAPGSHRPFPPPRPAAGRRAGARNGHRRCRQQCERTGRRP